MKDQIAALPLFLLALLLPTQLSAQTPEYKVGFVLSLTGSWAEYGAAEQNALELARSEHPDSFRHIKFIYEDCGHQGALTVSAYDKLTGADRIDILFAWGVQPVEILAPRAEAVRLPMIASAQVAAAARGRKFIIRSLNYSEQYSSKLLQFLRTQNAPRLALIQTQMSYYDLLADGIRKNLAPGESLELVDSIGPAAADFRTTVLKTKTKSFDSLGLFLTPPQILEFLGEAEQQGLKTPIFGMHAFQSASLVSQAHGRLNGAVYVHNLVTEDFRVRYLSRFKDDSQISWAANTYDMACLIADALNSSAKRLSNDEIMDKLQSFPERQGAGGRFVYRDTDETGKYFEYPLGVYKIDNGKHVLIMQ